MSSPPAEGFLDSALSSSSTSITGSIFAYTYAHGRRYHSDRFAKAAYFLPNDEGEQARLDLYHHIFCRILGGRLYTAPLAGPRRVLDVGTGTGIWAMDFADAHPAAEIHATDLSPIQPAWAPPNVRFEVDDAEEEWAYPAAHFDYVHMRTLSGSFRDWGAVLRKAYEHLVPGGYVEFQDYGAEVFAPDGTLLSGPLAFPAGTCAPGESHVAYLFHLCNKASFIAGRPVPVARGMAERIAAAGFADVTVRTELWPLGEWPKDPALKELGKLGRVGLYDGLHAFAVHLLTKNLGWAPEKVEELVDLAKEDLLRGRYYCEAWFVYGRKPEVGEEV
ncbi:S-adenosyl-L-methionine-dependent methyltransferase [Peziza echinospora]|nr:S-adenosyl-L-methionine-dependent methyltransferase [Peziza echinospora]